MRELELEIRQKHEERATLRQKIELRQDAFRAKKREIADHDIKKQQLTNLMQKEQFKLREAQRELELKTKEVALNASLNEPPRVEAADEPAKWVSRTMVETQQERLDTSLEESEEEPEPVRQSELVPSTGPAVSRRENRVSRSLSGLHM